MSIPTHHLRRIIGVIAGSLCACIAIAATSPTGTQAAPGDVLDEVQVSGTRLWQLRAAVINAEDRLLARYNELNLEDDFDIECENRTATGTLISRRYCFTVLQKRIEQKNAWATVTYLFNQDVLGMTAPIDGQIELLERAADYKKNLVTLLQDDAGLRALAKQHGEVRRRLESALQDRWQARQSP